jgi:hypothetical protein
VPEEDDEVLGRLRAVIFQMEAPDRDVSKSDLDHSLPWSLKADVLSYVYCCMFFLITIALPDTIQQNIFSELKLENFTYDHNNDQ